MARSRTAPVPHHLVEASLYDAAAEKAAQTGISMSRVASIGLSHLAAEAPRAVALSGKVAAKGSLKPEALVQELPRETFTQLQRMRQDSDPLLNPYLVALANAGWSYSTLAEPLGVSRQAIYDRVRKLRGAELPKRLPPVPEPPFQAASPYSLGYERVDWPVWVDREVYAIAAQEARRRLTPMRVVMENILRDFISDTGPWENQDT